MFANSAPDWTAEIDPKPSMAFRVALRIKLLAWRLRKPDPGGDSGLHPRTPGRHCCGILHYRNKSGPTTGVPDELEHTNQIDRQMICRYGMDASFGLTSAPETVSHDEAVGTPICHRVSVSAGRIQNQETEAAPKLVEENCTRWNLDSRDLLAKNRIYRNDLPRFMARFPGGRRGFQHADAEFGYAGVINKLNGNYLKITKNKQK